MSSMEIYIIKSGTVLSILYSLYWILLRNETHHSLNRIYLLGSMSLSLIIPAICISLKEIPANTYSNIIEPIIINNYNGTPFLVNPGNSIRILSIIYISGAVFFTLRFLSNLAKIHFLYFRFPKCNFNGFKAVILDNNQAPFTFFNVLFISRCDYEHGKIDEMIVHEKAHKDDYHSFDVILLELMTIIQWFNPFVWLLRLSLKSEHEFIADKKVLMEGFDKVRYQKLLFEKSLGIISLSFVNNFNYSLLKKRLKMMTIHKSNALVKIKYLVTMPLVLISLLVLLINFNSYGQEEVDVMAKYKNGNIDGVRGFIKENLVYPEIAKNNNVSAKIFIEFIINKNGDVKNVTVGRCDILNDKGEVAIEDYQHNTNPEIDPKSVTALENEALRVVKLLKDFTPAQLNGKPVETEYTFPINFVLTDDK